MARSFAATAPGTVPNDPDHALVVSPPSVGKQVVVSPIRFKGLLNGGTGALALALAVLQYGSLLLPVFWPQLAGTATVDLISTLNGGVGSTPLASALVVLATALRDGLAANGAAKVAANAVLDTAPPPQLTDRLSQIEGALSEFLRSKQDVLAQELERQRRP